MKFAVPINSNSGGFEVHAAGCRDLSKPAKRRELNLGRGDEPTIIEAESPAAAGLAALRSEFSDAIEHPERDGFPGGSFGAAGFDARVFPCAKGAR